MQLEKTKSLTLVGLSTRGNNLESQRRIINNLKSEMKFLYHGYLAFKHRADLQPSGKASHRGLGCFSTAELGWSICCVPGTALMFTLMEELAWKLLDE